MSRADRRGRGIAAAGKRALGLDEAGRGSVLGPLVVGGFLAEERTLGALPALGVRDSKRLSARQREKAYQELQSVGRCFSATIPASTVDRYVRHHGLNQLEAIVFAQLIRETRAEVVYADACDPNAPRFARVLRRLAGGRVDVHACHHADRDWPIVSAASIVAKVERDRCIARLSVELGAEFGSGYPADESTRRYLREILRPREETPSWVRDSWATTQRLKPKPAARPLESFQR